MKFSEAWLREWVSPELSTEALTAQLTMAGLEVDSVTAVAPAFRGVVVGEILSVAAHPEADKLRVCQVRGDQSEPVQVVCGAPNARAGLKVPFATVGAELPGGIKIKKAKLRGIESAGMLCSQVELQLGDDDSGLWPLADSAVAGTDLRKYLNLDDTVIEVDLTPNRADCLSVLGMAREIAALNQIPFVAPSNRQVAPEDTDSRDVRIEAAAECPVYVGRVIEGIDNTVVSPPWLTEKLRRSGIRSIDPVVDVTNFVLLELGQPMHAFDQQKLEGAIQVRLANAGESIDLLNGQTVSLRGDTLVIADDSGPVAMAGIMGGGRTAVSPQTASIFLESAFFSPVALAGKARSYGLHTDSSHRFERGVDYRQQTRAIERATELLLQITGGTPGPVQIVEYPDQLPVAPVVELRPARVSEFLGTHLKTQEIDRILTGLGLEKIGKTETGIRYQVPSYRFDIALEVDLIEEIARVYGYDRLPVKNLTIEPALERHSETRSELSDVKRHLVSRGYQEVITYSFIDPALQEIVFPEERAVTLQNPISSDMAIMRTSLIPGLLKTLKSNINRQQTRARLFESGLRFSSPDGSCDSLQQEPVLGVLLYGAAMNDGWGDTKRAVDIFDLKGDIESLLQLSARGVDLTFEACTDVRWLHPGQAARLVSGGDVIGHLGALHPEVAKKLEFSKPVYAFECRLQPLLNARLPRFSGISRFPEVSRDLAIMVNEKVAFAELEKDIRRAAGDVLKSVRLFDVYSGEGITPGEKSLAFSLIFQDSSRTLKEDEVTQAMAAIMATLKQQHHATLR